MQSFCRQKRLLNSKEFQAVFDHNNCRVSNAGLLLLAYSNQRGYPRLGLVVAKKHLKRAVDRNRVKRVARETFRAVQSDLGGVDVVFLARKGLGELTPGEQTRLFQKSWNKLVMRLGETRGSQ